MAADLAGTPVTGRHVQVCGDCQLGNFGLFATPERNVIFDLNDFDEKVPAPWEWDVKRLAASTVRAYREHMRSVAAQSPLTIWFANIDARTFLSVLGPQEAQEIERKQRDALARGEHLPPTYVANRSGKLRFVENPPVLARTAPLHSFKAGQTTC